ncbi:MAG: threonine ammonia-lyase, biosynthetic [Lysobacterales bacterium]
MDEIERRYLHAVLTARVYELAQETALQPMPRLSRRLHTEVRLKREDTQPVFSFKLRGAANKLAQLPAEVVRSGVIAVSAGNHAQGVAMAARALGVPALIVMPQTTPAIKVEAVAALGAEVLLVGDSYDEAAREGRRLADEQGRYLVHPYDDPEVIAGQGTVGLEILRQNPGPLGAVFVPVGGGGLAAGVTTVIKALRPEVAVYGVEPDDAACLDAALTAGEPVELPQVGLFVDGVAVKRIGDEPFRLLQSRIDGVVKVSTDEICAAIKDVFEDTRVVLEPAGALALAGAKRWLEEGGSRSQPLVAIASGANMNFDRLRHVAERAEIGEHHEAVLGVTIPERAGAFLEFCRLLGSRAVTEFNYRYADAGAAEVFVGISLRQGDADRGELIEQFRQAGYTVRDYSGNELAKLHIRHLVGGRARPPQPERILRFEFPERPGALLRFLEHLGGGWNISLFHYRSHGAAYGRVLAGFEVDPQRSAAFDRDLAELGYSYVDETANPAVGQFL